MGARIEQRAPRRSVVAYVVAMTVIGVTAFFVTLALADSLWWALGALLVAGPVGRVVLGALGLDPSHP